MDKVARDLAEATLDAVRGIDARLDAQLAALDALTVFRTGAEHHLALLPRIAEDTAATRQGVERIEGRLDTMPSQIVAELMAELDRRGEARAAEQAGLQRQAVIALARRNSANVDDFDQALRELERAVVIAIEAGATPARAGNLDAFVGQELARVAELSNAGRFDDAAAEAERAIARWEREEEERRKRALADGLALLEAGIRQDLLRRDAQAAAAKIARRVELEVADRAGLFQRLRAVGGEWFVWGRDGGLNLDLEVSIELARIAFEVAGDADERGVGLNELGTALSILGERETGTERLVEAIVTYRAALEEFTRERVPLDWAATQNNLGNAYRLLGERETGTERLEQAIVAYRAALEERTCERVPLDWAMTQTNLGAALSALGKRETGTESLEQAITAYRAALEEWTRERVPFQWATAQNNLGNALSDIGEREAGTERLEQAIAAYRAALEERTRERVPLDWAMTQNNLGNALSILGEREDSTERLEQAVAACRAALEEWTQERMPLKWAMTQNNLGAALRALGERETGTERLKQALAAYRAALEEWTRERVPLDWAMTQHNLGNALRVLGEREAGAERLEQALAAYRAALEERTPDRVPLDWAVSIGNQGRTMVKLAGRTGDAAMAADALSQIEAAHALCRNVGHDPYADVFAFYLPEARALVERLGLRPSAD
ncbi:tetratricopeptide repeat protein [Ancylobacter lacus]|nr:tetratricopeptide repeat protein [Ancylobacter lacus]